MLSCGHTRFFFLQGSSPKQYLQKRRVYVDFQLVVGIFLFFFQDVVGSLKGTIGFPSPIKVGGNNRALENKYKISILNVKFRII